MFFKSYKLNVFRQHFTRKYYLSTI